MEPQRLVAQSATPDTRQPGLLKHLRDLWRDAPAWRLLVGSTAALFAASVATAVIGPRHENSMPPTVTAAQQVNVSAPVAIEAPPAVRGPSSAPLAAPPAPVSQEPAPQAPAPVRPGGQLASRPALPDRQSATAPSETACNFRGGSGSGGQGRVVGFLSRDQAANLLALTQNKTGAKINPDYVRNTRVVLTVPNGRRVVVLLPPSLVVKPGDRVAFASGHRDWSMACGYIPNLIIGLLQPE